jgi:hypothetical protein
MMLAIWHAYKPEKERGQAPFLTTSLIHWLKLYLEGPSRDSKSQQGKALR